MNNYITIYVTSRMLVDALMESVDDIANENFDIELSKDEVEIHATKVSDTAELPPENMADFLSNFKNLVSCKNVQLSDDILFDIKELSWSSALWDNDVVIETSEFEYDKEDKESRFAYSKGDERKEHSTDESAIAKSKPKKSVTKKAKRVAPKGSAPQLSGAESPAELAEKWFDYWRAKYEAMMDEINERNRQHYSAMYFDYFWGGSFTDESEDSFVRIAYSDSGKLGKDLKNSLSMFGLDDDALSELLIEPTADDYTAIRKAFSESKFESAVDMLSTFLGFMFSDGKDHPTLLEKIKPLFIESAAQCKDINRSAPEVDVSGVLHDTLENAVKSFKLQDNGATYTITAYVGKDKDVNIPGFVDGKAVYKIDDAAFSSEGNKSRKKQLNAIETVVIPNTVQVLGEDVFAGCKKLKKVVFSDAVLVIPEGGEFDGFFSGCEELEEVVLPKYLEELQSGVFHWCTSLKSIVLPNTLKYIGSQAFAECRNLSNITLPDSVEEIADRAFSGCDAFTEIVFPPKIKIVRQYACSGRSLERVVFPDGIEEVESHAFGLAKRLKEVVTPDKFVKWGCMAIDDDSPLYNHYGYDKEDPSTALRYINKNLIGYVGNYSGKVYADVYIQEGTVRLVDFALSYVSNIEKVHIPQSVVDIEDMAFNCSSNLIICAAAGSVAEEYAKRHNMQFEAE